MEAVEKTIKLMVDCGEYNETSARAAIQRMLMENKDRGMTWDEALNATIEYMEITLAPQPCEAETKAKLEKKIFRTLKNYSHGYYGNCSAEERKAYDAKVEKLKARILADVEHAPEIIAEEFASHQATMYRAQMTGKYATLKCNAEWKAIDNVCMALVDAKPYKATK